MVAETTPTSPSSTTQQAEPRAPLEVGVASPPAHSPIVGPTAAPIEPDSERSFTGRIEGRAKRKVKAKKDGRKDGWDEKTANQHRSVARLFAKRAGTDDPTRMSQEDVGAYRNLLDVIPKTWGKSSKDEFRSLEEILARSEDLDEDEIGLQWGTINRHMTQLGNCLSNLKGHGITIGQVTKDMRASGEPRVRNSFTTVDETTLFGSGTWMGPNVIHSSQYFVPLFGNISWPG